MRPPIDRFQLAVTQPDAMAEPVVPPGPVEPVVVPSADVIRLPGVQRWVDQHEDTLVPHPVYGNLGWLAVVIRGHRPTSRSRGC